MLCAKTDKISVPAYSLQTLNTNTRTGASRILESGTIFAPVDAAFRSLSEEMGLESTDALLEEDNVRALADILKYHGE